MKAVFRHFFHIDHLIVSAFTIGIIGLLVLIAVNVEFLNPVVRAVESFSMTDVYYRIQHSITPETNKQITLVDITALSSRDRDRIAEVVEQISEMRPTALGVDVIFEGLKGNPDSDEQLTDAFFHTPENTVLAYKLTDPDEDSGIFRNAVHSFFAADTHQVEGTVKAHPNMPWPSIPWSFSIHMQATAPPPTNCRSKPERKPASAWRKTALAMPSC